MNAQMQDGTPASATAGANAQAQVVIAGTAGLKTKIGAIVLGFSGAAPAAPVQATISDGTATVYLSVGANGVIINAGLSMVFAAGAAVTITLPAGGAGAIGSIAAVSYQDK